MLSKARSPPASHRQPAARGDRRGSVVEVGFACLAQSQVGRSGVLDQVAHARAHLHRVARCGDQHVRQRAHQRVVLHRMVRVAERAVSEAAADRDDRHRQPVVGHVVADLLGTAERREVRDRVREDVVALGGHAGGDARHVLFGHAGVDEAVGELVGEGLDDRVAEVADDQRDLRVRARERHQFLDESVTHGSRVPGALVRDVRRTATGSARPRCFP